MVTATQMLSAEIQKADINANVKMVLKVMAKDFVKKLQMKNHAKKRPIHARKMKIKSQT